jgi:signal transduction histidine kinase
VETFTDPTALEIIVKNLIDNAVKYSAAAPRVHIEVEALQSGHLGITVRDHGIGIERSQLRRIFKRFHRAPDPLVDERSGSGLGLFVVERLVRNLGGRIRAESAGPGKGTTMLVRLPMASTVADGASA